MPDRLITVLYVDDDDALGRLVQRILGRRGYVVEHCADAASGLARVEAGGVDVVILDHDLGASSGLELLRVISAREAAPPVVYVTASVELSIAVEALKAGAVDYVVKTVGQDFEVLLVSALEQSVEKARLMRAKERAEREVREARDRAMFLLAEVNHRVANSLALVNSLVRLQSGAVKEPAARAALTEIQARIAAIANLHRSLYAAEDVRSVDLGPYLTSIVEDLQRSVSAAGSTPEIRLRAESIIVKPDAAVAIGMIAIELVTNAVKYAYPEGGGEVRVDLSGATGEACVLLVEDDGIGWSGAGSQGTGLGGKILSAMGKTLSAEVVFPPVAQGLRAEIESVATPPELA